MKCIKRFVHELYLIKSYKIKYKNHGIFFIKYDMADEVAQQKHSNIRFYFSAFRYI